MSFSIEWAPSFAASTKGDAVLAATDQLIQFIREKLHKQIDNLPSKQVVLDAAAKAYDQYIAPLDIPGVPAALEPWVDQMLKTIFLRLVAGLYDQLQAV